MLLISLISTYINNKKQRVTLRCFLFNLDNKDSNGLILPEYYHAFS